MQTLLQQRTRHEIQERLLLLGSEDRRLWGVMSAGEMLRHLQGAFELTMGQRPSTPVNLPIPRGALKATALWAPLPWRRNFQTYPSLERSAPGMQPGDFELDRRAVLEAYARFVAPDQPRADHPFFGPMSAKDWMRWGFLHTDHHLRQFGR